MDRTEDEKKDFDAAKARLIKKVRNLLCWNNFKSVMFFQVD